MQNIATELEIDYKILYKIVGFLNENENIIENKKTKIKNLWLSYGKEKKEKLLIFLQFPSKKYLN
ncbi:hypothetical protein [Fusobacterium varium]|uniref:hypothetical protein n=1 Tax=Fusobacterium varium TaxID=856 RepID=UPI002FF37659